MIVQKVYYMINTVLQLSTPTLIIGGMACTTLIPAMEAALRAIVGTGQLMINRCHCSYTKWNFSPSTSFTTTTHYKNIGLEYIAKIKKDIDDSKIPAPCKYNSNKPNSKLTLQYQGKTDCTFNLDKDSFKKYSVYYKEMSEDFDAYNKEIGADADDQTQQCIVPAIFSEESFQLLNYYLNNKALFNNKSPELKKLDLEKFIDLYKLSIYLQIPDLEARCVRTIKENIDAGLIDIDQFDNSPKYEKYNEEDCIKYGQRNYIKYNEKYHVEDKKFKDFLVSVKNYKQTYNVIEFQTKLDDIELSRLLILNKIAKQINFSFKCIGHSLVPIVGPIYTHMWRLRQNNELTGKRPIPSISSDLMVGVSVISAMLLIVVGTTAVFCALSYVVAKVASIALLPIKAAFFVLGNAFKVIVFVATPILKVIVFVATPILKVTGTILAIGLLAAALIR